MLEWGVFACLSLSGSFPHAAIIVRNPEGRIRLYCKGADTLLLDRLHPSTPELLSTTTDHLNVGVMRGLVVLTSVSWELGETVTFSALSPGVCRGRAEDPGSGLQGSG